MQIKLRMKTVIPEAMGSVDYTGSLVFAYATLLTASETVSTCTGFSETQLSLMEARDIVRNCSYNLCTVNVGDNIASACYRDPISSAATFALCPCFDSSRCRCARLSPRARVVDNVLTMNNASTAASM